MVAAGPALLLLPMRSASSSLTPLTGSGHAVGAGGLGRWCLWLLLGLRCSCRQRVLLQLGVRMCYIQHVIPMIQVIAFNHTACYCRPIYASTCQCMPMCAQGCRAWCLSLLTSTFFLSCYTTGLRTCCTNAPVVVNNNTFCSVIFVQGCTASCLSSLTSTFVLV
jgi:hypothetical protein